MKYSLFMMSPCLLHPHQDLCACSYDFSEGRKARFFNWRKGYVTQTEKRNLFRQKNLF